MRNSQRLQAEAIRAHEAELSRDKADVQASIDNFTDQLAVLKELHDEDLKHIDQIAATQKGHAIHRYEAMRAHIEARIEKDKSKLRDLEGVKAIEEPKKEEPAGEQQQGERPKRPVAVK